MAVCAKLTVAFLFRVAWETVGAIVTRAMSDVDAVGHLGAYQPTLPGRTTQPAA